FKLGESVFEGIELVDVAFELAFFAFELVDFALDGVGVDRTHDQVSQILALCDGATGLVGFEEERKQVGEFSVSAVEVWLAICARGCRIGGYCPVRPLKRANIGAVADSECGVAFLGVAFERDVLASESGHQRLEERGSIRGIPPGKYRYSRGKGNVGMVDATD